MQYLLLGRRTQPSPHSKDFKRAVCGSRASSLTLGMSLSDGQQGRSPHGSSIAKWPYIERGINQGEFGSDFLCAPGWEKKLFGFGADISIRLLKLEGGEEKGTGSGSPSKCSQKQQDCLPEAAHSVFAAHPRKIKRQLDYKA